MLLRIHAKSDPPTLGNVRRRVRAALIEGGLNAKAADEMEVAVGETLSNVHRHAYHGDAGPVFVSVFRSESVVSVTVIDRGDATETPTIPRTTPPLSQDHGRGLYAAQQLPDAVVVRVNHKGHGIGVAIRKRLESRPRDT